MIYEQSYNTLLNYLNKLLDESILYLELNFFYTSRKIAIIIGFKRLFSSVFDPKLIQETLNHMSV